MNELRTETRPNTGAGRGDAFAACAPGARVAKADDEVVDGECD
jgi:hypothetical protein